MMMPRLVRFLLAIAALALVSPAYHQVWRLTSAGPELVQLPEGSRPLSLRVTGDLDGDGNDEFLRLSEGRLWIRSNDETRWASPYPWFVRQALIADLNHDGRLEAVLRVSRPFQPWPVDAWLPHGGRIDDFHDVEGYSSHIILIGWDGDSYREVWAGSAMADPARQIAVVQMEGAGEVLVTLEALYDDPVSMPARGVKVWEWNGFGFSLVFALEGPFSRMEIHEDRVYQYLVLSK